MSDIIKLLPDSVANQIAAGEVIQRPASVIKELVENAVDAGATSIEIILKDAGRTLIQVIDNGCGMSDTDARMAFERHATSKISNATDLFALHTMGFRGEALASIAAIAHVDLRTMPHGASLGTRLIIHGSQVESQNPEACSPGSNMMVKNLFFNVPARRKFLKKDSVELSAVMREFERLALVNTSIDFTLVHNDVTLFALRREPLLRRIGHLFGKNVDKQVIEVETETSLVKISGYTGLPEHSRRRNPLQYLFVNGRNMRHPLFHKAILSCYEQLIPADEQPNYFLNFIVDPDTIDVNIHPTKNEIKFENEMAIRQILVAAVRESLGRFNAVPSIDFDRTDAPDIPVFSPDATAAHGVDLDPNYNPFKASGSATSSPAAASSWTHHGSSGLDARSRNWEQLYDSFATKRDAALESAINTPPPSLDSNDAGEPVTVTLQGELDLDFDHKAPTVMQLKNRYIMSPSREGLMIVDQHRAHKRILYDRYLKASAGSSISSQRVIFPEVLHLSPSQGAIMESIAKDVATLGFDVAFLGDNAWSINGVPAALNDVPPSDMLLAIIESVTERGGKVGENMRERIALSMAATAAVKPGQPLSRDEIDRITSELFRLPSPGYTPDGQRTFTVLHLEEISKMLG